MTNEVRQNLSLLFGTTSFNNRWNTSLVSIVSKVITIVFVVVVVDVVVVVVVVVDPRNLSKL